MPIFTLNEEMRGTSMVIDRPNPAQTVILENTLHGYAYHHASSGYDGEINDKMYVGRDFDFFNERWRGFTEFDISTIPDSANITHLRLRLYISGKPKVCDNQRAQIGFFPMQFQPSQTSYDFKTLFEDIGNGTQYNNADQYILSEDGFYPGNTTWINFGNDSIHDIQTALIDDWFAFGVTDYYIDSLGHDSDQDEGMIFEISTLEINYSINAESYLAQYEGEIDTSGQPRGSANDSGTIAIIIILITMLIAVVLVALRKRFDEPEKSGHTLFKSTDNISEKERNSVNHRKKVKEEKIQLKKFKEILEMSQRVKIADIAKSLGMDYNDLFEKLLKWNKGIPFKIDGEMIVVEDMNTFIGALDQEFQQWENQESTEEGKI
jgi:hypothetical protein